MHFAIEAASLFIVSEAGNVIHFRTHVYSYVHGRFIFSTSVFLVCPTLDNNSCMHVYTIFCTPGVIIDSMLAHGFFGTHAFYPASAEHQSSQPWHYRLAMYPITPYISQLTPVCQGIGHAK